MATADHEDFSFPATTTDSPPRFIESPPLWRPSKYGNSKGKEVQDGEKFNLEFKSRGINYDGQRKSFSYSYDDDKEEEKMDMLWEMALNSDISSSPSREVQLKLSKGNGHMFLGKKLNILVFIKVLKKVFAIHKSHRSIKKRAW